MLVLTPEAINLSQKSGPHGIGSFYIVSTEFIQVTSFSIIALLTLA